MPAFLIVQLHCLQDVTLEASSLYKKLLNYMQQVTMLMKGLILYCHLRSSIVATHTPLASIRRLSIQI